MNVSPTHFNNCLQITLADNWVSMGGMEIARWQTLDVLGTSIRADLGWYDHIFNVTKEAAKSLGFFKPCKKYFTLFDLHTIHVTYIRPKMDYNSHLWAAASKNAVDFVDRIQSRALKHIEDDSYISSLGHRCNVSSIVLFYKYYFELCVL